MIRGDDDQGLGMAALELRADAERGIEIEQLMQHRAGIVVVAGVVDASPFDYEKNPSSASSSTARAPVTSSARLGTSIPSARASST